MRRRLRWMPYSGGPALLDWRCVVWDDGATIADAGAMDVGPLWPTLQLYNYNHTCEFTTG